MDALTINGAKNSKLAGNGVRFFNWASPDNTFDFSSAPDFSNVNWQTPNRVPQNPYNNANVGYYGIASFLKSTVPDQSLTLETSNIDLHNEPRPGYVDLYYRWDGVRKYLEKEKELLEEFFNIELPTLVIDGAYYRPEEISGLLSQAYNDDTKGELYLIWNALNLDSQGGVLNVDTELIQNQLQGFFDFFTGQGSEDEIIENAAQMAINTPFDLYGPGDSMRLMRYMVNSHNYQSFAYGDGSKFTMFPPRDSFWDKLWAGMKKFFPGLVIARNAMLGLIGLNAFNLAVRINDSSDSKKTQLRKAWENLGGSTSSFNGAVNSGKNKNPILGDAGATATLIAACTPILMAIIKILGGNENIETVANAVNSAASANCQEYSASMIEFVTAFHLEDTDAGNLMEQFDFAFPEIPDECLDALTDIYETFTGDEMPTGGDGGDSPSETDGDGGTSPGGNDSGGGVPPGETESPNEFGSVGKIVLPLALIYGISKL